MDVPKVPRGPLNEREWAAVLLAADEKAQVLTPAGHSTAAALRNRAILLLARHGLKGVALPGLTLGQLSVSRRGAALDSTTVPSHDDAELCAGCAVVDWAEVIAAHRADGDAGVWVAVRRTRNRRTHRCRRPWTPPPEFGAAPLFRSVSKAGRLGHPVSRERLRSTLLAAARRAGITRPLGLGAFGCGVGPLSQVAAPRPITEPGIVTVTEEGPDTGEVAEATRRAYLADWRQFEAWCRAQDRIALPAEPATVDDFLADHPAPAATHRRRRTAIRHIHRHQEQPLPTTPRPRRPGQPQLRPENLTGLLSALPRTGWTAGIFGRRDALLLLLRQRAGLTVPELHALTTADLARYGGELHVLVGDEPIVLRKTRRTADCPGCCWLRWQVLLRHARFHSPATVLAGLVSAAPSDEHVCDRPEQLELGAPVPVFPPLNRWGAFPLPLHAAGVRSLTALTGAHASGNGVLHPTVRIRITLPRREAEAPPAPPVDTRTTAEIAAAGMAARRRAVADLAGTKERLDEVEDTLDDLHDRLERLMAAAWT